VFHKKFIRKAMSASTKGSLFFTALTIGAIGACWYKQKRISTDRKCEGDVYREETEELSYEISIIVQHTIFSIRKHFLSFARNYTAGVIQSYHVARQSLFMNSGWQENSVEAEIPVPDHQDKAKANSYENIMHNNTAAKARGRMLVNQEESPHAFDSTKQTQPEEKSDKSKARKSSDVDVPVCTPKASASKTIDYGTPDTATISSTISNDDEATSISSAFSSVATRSQRRNIFGDRVTSKYVRGIH
jgi:hypothetical protein